MVSANRAYFEVLSQYAVFEPRSARSNSSACTDADDGGGDIDDDNDDDDDDDDDVDDDDDDDDDGFRWSWHVAGWSISGRSTVLVGPMGL